MAAHRIERKLTAIFSADVKGYSRLMGEDEEGTLYDQIKNKLALGYEYRGEQTVKRSEASFQHSAISGQLKED